MLCCMACDGEAGGSSPQQLWAVVSRRTLAKFSITGLEPSNQHTDNDVGGGKVRFGKSPMLPLCL